MTIKKLCSRSSACVLNKPETATKHNWIIYFKCIHQTILSNSFNIIPCHISGLLLWPVEIKNWCNSGYMSFHVITADSYMSQQDSNKSYIWIHINKKTMGHNARFYLQLVVFKWLDEEMICRGQNEIVSCRNNNQHWKTDHLFAAVLHVNTNYLTNKVLQCLSICPTTSSRLGP